MAVADTVYLNLRQALTISALAETFQTSHMPVREALRRLGAEGAVQLQPNGSAHVPQALPKALEDINRARMALEGLAAELAAQRISGPELTALEELEARHRAAAETCDVHQMLERNRDFHFGLYAAAGSPVLLELIESLWLRYGPFKRRLSDHISPQLEQGTHEPFARGHQEIVAAVRARDPQRAREAVCHDIAGTRRLLETLCAEA